MPRIIDISIPLSPQTPVWSGDPDFKINRLSELQRGDAANVSSLHMSLHTGTHIDAPSHFIQNGMTVDQIPADIFFGACQVVGIQSCEAVTISELPPITQKKILFRTINSERMRSGEPVSRNFIALTEPVVEELLKQSVELIGIDYYSIEPDGDYPLHRRLLNESVILLEGLDLSGVEPGEYQLICFPLRIQDAEASPVRAVLICDDDG